MKKLLASSLVVVGMFALGLFLNASTSSAHVAVTWYGNTWPTVLEDTEVDFVVGDIDSMHTNPTYIAARAFDVAQEFNGQPGAAWFGNFVSTPLPHSHPTVQFGALVCSSTLIAHDIWIFEFDFPDFDPNGVTLMGASTCDPPGGGPITTRGQVAIDPVGDPMGGRTWYFGNNQPPGQPNPPTGTNPAWSVSWVGVMTHEWGHLAGQNLGTFDGAGHYPATGGLCDGVYQGVPNQWQKNHTMCPGIPSFHHGWYQNTLQKHDEHLWDRAYDGVAGN